VSTHDDSFRPLVKLALKKKCEEVMTWSKILTLYSYDIDASVHPGADTLVKREKT